MDTLYNIIDKINELNLWREDGALDESKLSELDIPLDTKLENLALYIKNEEVLAASIRSEEKALAARRTAHENRATRLSEYLLSTLTYLGYKKREFPRVVITTRQSVSVEFDDDFVAYAEANGYDSLLTYKAPTPNKTAIKAAIALGEVVEHARLVEKTNINIK